MWIWPRVYPRVRGSKHGTKDKIMTLNYTLYVWVEHLKINFIVSIDIFLIMWKGRGCL